MIYEHTSILANNQCNTTNLYIDSQQIDKTTDTTKKLRKGIKFFKIPMNLVITSEISTII